ncbi:hypothetical protein REPUB_Repub16aG0002100 [Reevesia pubescens]
MLLNNLCECFNKYILDEKDKPILTMVELIRNKLMNRFYVKKTAAKNYTSVPCPKIQKKLDKYTNFFGMNWPQLSTQRKFQVKCPGSQFSVDLDEQSYSCRK